MTNITIRYATADDATLLAELGARTFYDTFAADNTPENMSAHLTAAFSPAIQAAELADPSVFYLIAEIDGAVVGFAKLQTGEPPAEVRGPSPIEINRFYSVKEWIGHGVGPALMQACLDEAQKRGHETVWLGVWEHNPRAQAFYRKWGFVEVGSHIFPVGDDPQVDLYMKRPINL
jgi:GNAT superfamily N-acetyltransferase